MPPSVTSPAKSVQGMVESFQQMYSNLDPAVVADLVTSPDLEGDEAKIAAALYAMSETDLQTPRTVHYDPTRQEEYDEVQNFVISSQERLADVIGALQGNRSVDHRRIVKYVEEDRKRAQELLKEKGKDLPTEYFKGLQNLITDQVEILGCYASLHSENSVPSKKGGGAAGRERTGADPAEVQRLRDELQRAQKEKKTLERQVDELLKEKDAALATASKSKSKEKASQATVEAVQQFVRHARRVVQRVRENAAEARRALEEERGRFEKDCRECEGALGELKNSEIREKLYQKMEKMYREEVALRKQYYNTIQELRGNIRVFCRVRPLLAYETKAGAEKVTEFPADDVDAVVLPDARGVAKRYTFNKVYGPECRQEDVFSDTLPLIDSVVDGFNVCVFAYGQTGSGKSFTMEGPSAEDCPDTKRLEELRGVNRRAVDRLFEIFKEREHSERSTVYLSVLEIYNEKVADLLAPAGKRAEDYKIRQGVHAVGEYEVPGNYVEGLTSLAVGSAKEVQAALDKAKSNRKEGKHDMNKHSSRSHMILTLVVCTKNLATGQESFGKLNLIDLAGSERLSKTGATGQLAEEAKNINQSLTCLGKVIHDLQSGAKHVNFRDSKLTHLLQDSLGGNSKVLMFANCSPASINQAETKNTLDMASRAMKVSLGQATKNKVR